MGTELWGQAKGDGGGGGSFLSLVTRRVMRRRT